MRMLAGEGIMGIWELQVAAANAHRRGQSAVAVMLTEIVDAAEQEWRLAVDSRLTSTWIAKPDFTRAAGRAGRARP